MDLEDELTAVLKRAFPNSVIKLEPTASGRIGGYLIAEAFKGMAHMERQDMLWQKLAARLAPPVLDRIVAILTMTPDEVLDD